MRTPNSRPATFSCAWCGAEKALARTGRMPRFCSDYCRRQPVQAVWQLQSAIATRDAAQHTIDRLSANLERYRALERPETRSAEHVSSTAAGANGSRASSRAETVSALPAQRERFEVVNL